MPRDIAIAVDFSAPSRKAFDWAVEHLLREDDVIHLIHSMPLSPGYPALLDASAAESLAQMNSTIERHATLQMDALADILQAKNIHFATYIRKGEPKELIVSMCEEIKPSFLVLGSRGLGTFTRMMVGSVSDHCVHNCHCPVLVTK